MTCVDADADNSENSKIDIIVTRTSPMRLWTIDPVSEADVSLLIKSSYELL